MKSDVVYIEKNYLHHLSLATPHRTDIRRHNADRMDSDKPLSPWQTSKSVQLHCDRSGFHGDRFLHYVKPHGQSRTPIQANSVCTLFHITKRDRNAVTQRFFLSAIRALPAVHTARKDQAQSSHHDHGSTCVLNPEYIFALGLCETDDVIINTLGAVIGTVSSIRSSTSTRLSDRFSMPRRS